MLLTDEQWLLVQPLIEAASSRPQSLQRSGSSKSYEPPMAETPAPGRDDFREAYHPPLDESSNPSSADLTPFQSSSSLLKFTAGQSIEDQPSRPHESMGAGRPPIDRRMILDGILWKLLNRQPWRALPACFGSHQVCYHYYHEWLYSGLLRRVIQALLADVKSRGHFEIEAAYKSHLVRFETVDNRTQVYILSSLAPSWQVQTAMLFYQFIASRFGHKLPGASQSPDPLERIFDNL